MQSDSRAPDGRIAELRSEALPTAEPTFSAVRVIASSLAIFARHLPVLLVLAAAFHALPLWLQMRHAQAFVGASEDWMEPNPQSNWGQVVLLGGTWLLVRAVLPLAMQALVAMAILRVLRGRPVGWTSSLRAGIMRLPRALITSLVLVLVVALPIVLLGIVGLRVGALLCGAALAALLCLAVQLTVVEGLDPLRALARSARLTRRAHPRIFAIVCLVYAGPPLLLYALRLAAFDGDGVLIQYVDSASFDVEQLWLQAAFDVFFGGWQAVVPVVLYHALRKETEGSRLDGLLAVFD